MRNVYVVSIIDNTGKMVSYTIIALTMAAAIGKAQELAGVSHDPSTFQKLATVDDEVV